MIRGTIEIQGENERELELALRALATELSGSCKLDVPEGKQRIDIEHDGCTLVAQFAVMPVYQEGDLEKFFGCAPDMFRKG